MPSDNVGLEKPRQLVYSPQFEPMFPSEAKEDALFTGVKAVEFEHLYATVAYYGRKYVGETGKRDLISEAEAIRAAAIVAELLAGGIKNHLPVKHGTYEQARDYVDYEINPPRHPIPPSRIPSPPRYPQKPYFRDMWRTDSDKTPFHIPMKKGNFAAFLNIALQVEEEAKQNKDSSLAYSAGVTRTRLLTSAYISGMPLTPEWKDKAFDIIQRAAQQSESS